MPLTLTAVSRFNLRAMSNFDLTANLRAVVYSKSKVVYTHKLAHV
jgi:hypothetical protein